MTCLAAHSHKPPPLYVAELFLDLNGAISLSKKPPAFHLDDCLHLGRGFRFFVTAVVAECTDGLC